jgi:hypothetical protein
MCAVVLLLCSAVCLPWRCVSWMVVWLRVPVTNVCAYVYIYIYICHDQTGIAGCLNTMS